MIHYPEKQGGDAWANRRSGCITGSRFKDCRDKLKNGDPSKACLQYAMDKARERCGGKVPDKFQNFAMREGVAQEPVAKVAYEISTGNLVDEVGFFTTDDGLFGLSPDGLIDADGVLEIKTMVASETLFKAIADGDLTEYMDQCNGYLWLLGRQWVDLVLWAPDMQELGLTMVIHRITRNEEEIEKLEIDLMKFAKLVETYEAKLKTRSAQPARPTTLTAPKPEFPQPAAAMHPTL